MEFSEAYRGREPTLLKHEVLRRYLQAWGQKLASTARNRAVTLWYVDCFAGPWRSKDELRDDTSAAIGVLALNEAMSFWREKGARVDAQAIFVEKDPKAFSQLEAMLNERGGEGVRVHALKGSFGENVGRIGDMLDDDPAFIFVDPRGWKGADMAFIAPLTQAPRRDVMVNVMYDYLNRFKGDSRAFLRAQMQDFFGLGTEELPPNLSEEQLMALYRRKLADLANLKHVADLAIPYTTSNRTFFRLVIGGGHTAVLELFRRVEAEVVGDLAPQVREAARHRDQLSLASIGAPRNPMYRALLDRDIERAKGCIIQAVNEPGGVCFSDLWPSLLAKLHLRKSDVREVAKELLEEGKIQVSGREKAKSVNEKDVLIPGHPRLFG